MSDAVEPRLWIAGAAPDTGNLGVSALCRATVAGLAARLPMSRFTVLDHGRSVRRTEMPVADDRRVAVELRGAVHGKRLHRPETLLNMWSCSLLGLPFNPHVNALRGADVFADISGGDSFTDLYGRKRFDSVCLQKRVALRLGVPLVLLPQTYGPFRAAASRDRAAAIVRSARLAFARDERSFSILRELVGADFDPERHRVSVDVAFALPAFAPRDPLPERVAAWIGASRNRPTVGLNVSGLIFHDPVRAERAFGFRADYRVAVLEITSRLAEHANVLLVPHVVTRAGHYESDPGACAEVAAALPHLGDRVAVLPALDDPSEVKSVIAACDWFCGTRMHATIAALSSSVPCTAIAYSDKTLGVFDTCGQGAEVVDPRTLDTGELVDRVVDGFERRMDTRRSLAERLPAAIARAVEVMDAITELVGVH